MKNLRIGVVGVGHIGSNHARLYAEIPSAEFTAVYDVDPFRSRTIGGKFGAAPAKSLDEFIDMVDAASVATPTNTHYAIARSLLTKGKHVLVEKPITDNTAHATELAELATHSGLVLQVGHVERFNPVLGALETHLTHPRFIEAHRLSPKTGLNRSTWPTCKTRPLCVANSANSVACAVLSVIGFSTSTCLPFVSRERAIA